MITEPTDILHKIESLAKKLSSVNSRKMKASDFNLCILDTQRKKMQLELLPQDLIETNKVEIVSVDG